jgi:hypothetical protein
VRSVESATRTRSFAGFQRIPFFWRSRVRLPTVQAVGSTPDTAKFNDATSTLGINFEYIASHTSKKYLD